MKIDVMRKIDHYAGHIICRFLLLIRALFGLKREVDEELTVDSCRNILIIKFFGMGTILLASPALRALKEKYKYAKITVLTLPSNRKLCEMLPSVDNVMCLEIHSIFSFLRSFFKNIFEIRKADFDVVIDLEFLTNFSALTTLLVTLLARPKISVGFNSPLKWRNDTHNINVSFDHSRHITEIFAKMVHSLKVEPFKYSFISERITLLKNMDTEYMTRLSNINNDLSRADFLVCINVNAGELCLHRRWPKEYFSKIVYELLKRPDIAIILIGGRQDVRYVQEFKKLLPPSSRIVDVSGQTNIKELIGLFATSNLLITNDSGPSRLAEIVGLPTISFFGPETPRLYGPLDSRHYVFYKDLYCSPCLNIYNSKISHCRNNTCLKYIDPESVLKVIENDYLPPTREFVEENVMQEDIDEVRDIEE